MVLAKDIMTPKPITLESSTSIKEAVEIFSAKKFSSVPVTTSMGEIAGQLTELALVRALVLHQIQPEKYKQLVHCLEMLEEAFFVAPTDSVTTIIKTILKSPSRRVLVKSDGRQILGIISPKDMLKFLTSGDPTAKSLQAEIGQLGDKKVG